jgi:hypothetical protein
MTPTALSFRGPHHGPRSEAEREARGIPEARKEKGSLWPEGTLSSRVWEIPPSPLVGLGARFAKHPGGAE